jgi:selenocysteine-specific translation elongation factor
LQKGDNAPKTEEFIQCGLYNQAKRTTRSGQKLYFHVGASQTKCVSSFHPQCRGFQGIPNMNNTNQGSKEWNGYLVE